MQVRHPQWGEGGLTKFPPISTRGREGLGFLISDFHVDCEQPLIQALILHCTVPVHTVLSLYGTHGWLSVHSVFAAQIPAVADHLLGIQVWLDRQMNVQTKGHTVSVTTA